MFCYRLTAGRVRAVIRAVKGTRDLLPPTTALWNHVEAVCREVFRRYNYQEIRTPILEDVSLFVRSVGEETDIVTKEMYTFVDRDGSQLALRPECTASVIRAYIEHRLDQRPGLQKLYYMGPMFRRERPQKGRYRQFYQIGAECIGSESPWIDAELIELVVRVLEALELRDFQLLLNSVGCRDCRPAYLQVLRRALQPVASRMCVNCQRRAETNPLRVLDCKVEADQAVIEQLPTILDHLCDRCREHFALVQRLLEDRQISFQIQPRLVRGLDYYTRTTFEITHGALGAQNAIAGGGRYDGLAEELGAKQPAPGIGFSIGEDRLVLVLETLLTKQGRLLEPALDLFIAPVGEEAVAEAARLASRLRRQSLAVEVGYGGKLKRLLELAHRLGARHTVIVGEDELRQGRLTLRQMDSGEQIQVTEAELLDRLARRSFNAAESASRLLG